MEIVDIGKEKRFYGDLFYHKTVNLNSEYKVSLKHYFLNIIDNDTESVIISNSDYNQRLMMDLCISRSSVELYVKQSHLVNVHYLYNLDSGTLLKNNTLACSGDEYTFLERVRQLARHVEARKARILVEPR